MTSSKEKISRMVEQRARKLGLLDGPQALVDARRAMLANAMADEKIDLFDEVVTTRAQWKKDREEKAAARKKALIESVQPGGGLDQLVDVLSSKTARDLLREQIKGVRHSGAYSSPTRSLLSDHQPHDILPQLLAGRSASEQELLLSAVARAVNAMENFPMSRVPKSGPLRAMLDKSISYNAIMQDKFIGYNAIRTALNLETAIKLEDVGQYSKQELLKSSVRINTINLLRLIKSDDPTRGFTENLLVDALLAQHFGGLSGVDPKKVAECNLAYSKHHSIQKELAASHSVFPLDELPQPSDEAYNQIPKDARALVESSGIMNVPDIALPAVRHKMVQAWQSLDNEAYSEERLQEISEFIFRQRQAKYELEKDQSRLAAEVWSQMQPGGRLAPLREIIEDPAGCRQLFHEIAKTKLNAKPTGNPIAEDAFVHDGDPASLIYQATKDVARSDMERYSPHLVKTLEKTANHAPVLTHLINDPSINPSSWWISHLSNAAKSLQEPVLEAPPTKAEFFYLAARGHLVESKLSAEGKRIINAVNAFELNRNLFEASVKAQQKQQAEEKAVQETPSAPSLFDRLFKRRSPEKADTPTPSGHRPG